MKLNPNCIRDVLFYLEDNLSITPDLKLEEISIFDLKNENKLDYSIQELANTLLTLHEAEFIEVKTDSGDNQITQLDVYRITYDGYQFIESIRPEPVWKKVTLVGKHIGSFSIDVITQIATGVLTSMVNGYLSGQLSP